MNHSAVTFKLQVVPGAEPLGSALPLVTRILKDSAESQADACRGRRGGFSPALILAIVMLATPLVLTGTISFGSAALYICYR